MTQSTRRNRAILAAIGLALLSMTAAPASAQTPPAAVEMVAAKFVGASEMDVAPGNNEIALAYSADGVNYSTAVPDLFAHSPKLVPGENLEEKLWVRNDNTMTVDISVAALMPGAPAWQESGPALRSEVTLNPGATGSLFVRMSLPASSGNNSQGQTQAVQLRVHVSESVPARSGESGGNAAVPDVSGPDTLGNTGATAGVWPVALALLLGGVGAWFGARKRSRRKAEAVDGAPARFEGDGL